MILLLSSLSAIIFYIIFTFRTIITHKLRLIDKPDKKLKKHKKKTPIIGGIVLLLNAIAIIIALYASKDFFYIKIISLAIACSLVGLIDDMYKISPNKKIIFLFFIIFFYLVAFNDQTIKFFVIEYNGSNVINFINKKKVAIIFTIFCYLLLINAYNMCDGHDGIALLLGIFWLSYFLIFKTTYIFLYPILLSLIFLFIFNIQSKIYLGDSGNYFISTLFASLIINYNNLSDQNFKSEEIFILLILPGIDMLRLFIERILKKKNPFYGDRNHLHHLLHEQFGKKLTILIYFLLFTTPILLYINKIFASYYIIIATIIIYIFTIKIIKK